MNSLSFYLSEKVFISSSLLKDSLFGYRILVSNLFLSKYYIFHSTLFLQGGFSGDVCCNSHLYSSVGKVLPHPSCYSIFQDFLFLFGFLSLNMIYLRFFGVSPVWCAQDWHFYLMVEF